MGTVDVLSRSLRISNRILRAVSGCAPAWLSVREGLPTVVRERESASTAG